VINGSTPTIQRVSIAPLHRRYRGGVARSPCAV